ncbi:hypothetical protein [Cohnella rhizosphaerae]|uniref:Uncharacterized protein n=1 Tax=Cohnella rhizosphaerae TaxID=1457232 RepID=A0A9X4QW73_9BACL|nr:hypothetical protein [Cohnella rhizosphaerae]MDG0812142.1 hypothetical protein [Cohnella rhizosphaerae]
MEQLIRFLFGNIYYVFVIAGVLYVLFRKSPLEKPPPKSGNRPAGRMPDFGGRRNAPPDAADIGAKAGFKADDGAAACRTAGGSGRFRAEGAACRDAARASAKRGTGRR